MNTQLTRHVQVLEPDRLYGSERLHPCQGST